VKKPSGQELTQVVFTDANADGFVNVKTYEAGVGDTAEVLADVTIRRTADGYEAQSNVEAEVMLGPSQWKLTGAKGWEKLRPGER
jgi:hypothetical protein